MAQQMVNGSYRKGSTTFTVRMSDRYAVVGEPFAGKHRKTTNSAWNDSNNSAWNDSNNKRNKKF